MTKHQQLLRYIDNLPVGEKISVRQLANDLNVSEGTAYRAIKEAEARSLVSAVPRVGTIRIEHKVQHDIRRLTFAEVLNIVDGSILGGRDGLHRALTRFLIGAMELQSLERYIEPDSLLIIGDRHQAHDLALSRGAAVLVSGGFDTTTAIKQKADRLDIPVISSSYDTFTIATMINQAFNERMIKKEIVRVEDVVVREPLYLEQNQTVEEWLDLSRATGHSRFPVVDNQLRVVGIITGKDVAGVEPAVPLAKVMTRRPFAVGTQATVASVAHLMVWQGIELVPVVEEQQLQGVVTRQDVIRALQFAQRQPQTQMTHADIVLSQFDQEQEGAATVLRGEVPPVAVDRGGNVSPGTLTNLLVEAARTAASRLHFKDMVAEALTVYFIHPVPPEKKLEVRATIIDIGRQIGKVDVVLLHRETVACKALISVQSLHQ